MTKFAVIVISSSLAGAVTKVQEHLVDGFNVTGNVDWRSQRHQLVTVEVIGDGDVDDCWVMLTSYGMSPSKELESTWSKMEDV